MNKKLDDAVKSYLPRLVQSVCESIRFPSIYAEDGSGFPYGLEIARAADHAMACARQLGFRVTDLNGRVSWAEFGEGEETVAVMGHLDVLTRRQRAVVQRTLRASCCGGFGRAIV